MRWLFDDRVLDLERRELRRAGALVAIEPQVFDLLVYLIRNRARVVSKDDLLDAVWQGRIVSDSALANRINAARAAVGDNGEDQTLIRTLPRKGFRFVGSVVEETAEPVRRAPGTDAAPQLVLPEQPSLVVLPFTDMSPDRNEGHFADGITEDLITELARIRWLFVIARNSAFTYKDRPVDVKQISRELGVRYVLEGSVRRSGQSMRINAQLVDATSGVHQWAERYDRDVGEIFAVQDEITSSVAAAVEPHLLVAEGKRAALPLTGRAQRLAARCSRPEPVLAAHESGFRCLGHHLDAGSREEPGLCARLTLSWALPWDLRPTWDGWTGASGYPLPAAMPSAPSRLDDRNPWGYSALGYAAMMQRRTEESLAAFRKAVSLTPSSAAAHGHLSHGLAFAGFADEAIKHGEIAMKLSPLDPAMALFRGGMAIAHYTARRFDEAPRLTEVRMRPAGLPGRPEVALRKPCPSGPHQEGARTFLLFARPIVRASPSRGRNNVPYQTPELMEFFIEGLRKAGLDAWPNGSHKRSDL